MAAVYRCEGEKRKALIPNSSLEGIDYLEVLDQELLDPSLPTDLAAYRQRLLVLYFIQKQGGNPTSPLGIDNISLKSSTQSVKVLEVSQAQVTPSGLIPAQVQELIPQNLRDVALIILTDRPGDGSPYTLCIVEKESEDTLPGYDIPLSKVDFSFKVGCPTQVDCLPDASPLTATATEPHIDYLARDYQGLRKVMLDRLAITQPSWTERHPADPYMALVEAIAYVGDRVSYYQDAVATEAYLGTARRRVSVRRHARLLNYRLSEGLNARTFIFIEAAPGTSATITGPSPFMEGIPGALPLQFITKLSEREAVIDVGDLSIQDRAASDCFEALHPLALNEAHNQLAFYTWQKSHCCLPVGATRATLLRAPGSPETLKEGDLLLLEEILGPDTGLFQDADPNKRHVVRLTSVEGGTDPLGEAIVDAQGVITGFNSVSILEIHWHQQDALPFALCLDEIKHEDGSASPVTVARGNILLADHGRTVSETLPTVVAGQTYRPSLTQSPLVWQGQVKGPTDWVPFDPSTSASSAFEWQREGTRPLLDLTDDAGALWSARWDLLGAGAFDEAFVPEIEDGGRAFLRMGDGYYGREPDANQTFVATYRLGGGPSGNVGALSLSHVVDLAGNDLQSHIVSVRNPLPARGGQSAEDIEAVKLRAPQGYRQQQRAINTQDWVDAAEALPDVQRAVARLKQTGSFTTLFLLIDRLSGGSVDEIFVQSTVAALEPLAQMGVRLEIMAPEYVSVELALTICVAEGHPRSSVYQQLSRQLGSGFTQSGLPGFFHPDNLTFGQDVPISPIIARAMSVAGVVNVTVDRFARYGQADTGGRLNIGTLEIARLNNDPSMPAAGLLSLNLLGGV